MTSSLQLRFRGELLRCFWKIDLDEFLKVPKIVFHSNTQIPYLFFKINLQSHGETSEENIDKNGNGKSDDTERAEPTAIQPWNQSGEASERLDVGVRCGDVFFPSKRLPSHPERRCGDGFVLQCFQILGKYIRCMHMFWWIVGRLTSCSCRLKNILIVGIYPPPPSNSSKCRFIGVQMKYTR